MAINNEKITEENNKYSKEPKNCSSALIKILILIIIYILFNCLISKHYKEKNNNITYLKQKERRRDLKTKKFAIGRRVECPQCGFFSFYIVNLGCIYKYLNVGYVPIIDLQSFPNVYNGNDTSKNNPWELFFYQPYNFTLEEVKSKARYIDYINCTALDYRPDEINMYYRKESIIFWHELAKKYMPIKNELMNEVEDIMKDLFGDSRNILGVKLRGTDYIAAKPPGHSIPPTVEQVISDVKDMDKQYNYDFIFFATEDELIREKFIPNFGKKLKMLNPKTKINYNYTEKDFINLNKNINGNIEYIKNYVINTIILSKCLDIVTNRCSGTAGIFILTNGFRHEKIYNLGEYQ